MKKIAQNENAVPPTMNAKAKLHIKNVSKNSAPLNACQVVRGVARSIFAYAGQIKLFVNPFATIVATPHPTVHEPPCNRPSGNYDRPQVPEARPGWHCH